MQRIFKSTFNKNGKRAMSGPVYEDEEHEVQFRGYYTPWTPIAPAANANNLMPAFEAEVIVVDEPEEPEEPIDEPLPRSNFDVDAYIKAVRDEDDNKQAGKEAVRRARVFMHHHPVPPAFEIEMPMTQDVQDDPLPDLEFTQDELDFVTDLLEMQSDTEDFPITQDDDFELFNDL